MNKVQYRVIICLFVVAFICPQLIISKQRFKIIEQVHFNDITGFHQETFIGFDGNIILKDTNTKYHNMFHINSKLKIIKKFRISNQLIEAWHELRLAI